MILVFTYDVEYPTRTDKKKEIYNLFICSGPIRKIKKDTASEHEGQIMFYI